MDIVDALKGKKVKIEEKNFSAIVNNVYKGTIEQKYVCGDEHFIKLIEGAIINVRYIVSIVVID